MRIPARGLTPYMQVQKLKDQDQVQDRDPHLHLEITCRERHASLCPCPRAYTQHSRSHAAKGMHLCVPAFGHTHSLRSYAEKACISLEITCRERHASLCPCLRAYTTTEGETARVAPELPLALVWPSGGGETA